jgi:hypothetical protein
MQLSQQRLLKRLFLRSEHVACVFTFTGHACTTSGHAIAATLLEATRVLYVQKTFKLIWLLPGAATLGWQL